MWLLLYGLTLLAGDVIAQGSIRRYQQSAPLRPFAPVYHNVNPYRRPNVQSQAAPASIGRPSYSHQSGNRRRPSHSGSICQSDTCGPNTRCEVARNGLARCRCERGYVPDEHTIKGCKPQCTSSNDCPDDYKCSNNKCVRVCVANVCGLNAECTARNHQAHCYCPDGLVGRGNYGEDCREPDPVYREPVAYKIDHCDPSPCGENSNCFARNDRPVCSCLREYEGNPLEGCRRSECIEHDDCPGHQACQQRRCIDPCPGSCGQGAECVVRDHMPICSCPRNYIGDAFTRCREIRDSDICAEGVCGPNTNCKVRFDHNSDSRRAVCSCRENYIGDPLDQYRGCYPECESDYDCPQSKGCFDNRCRNPCAQDGACGEDAYCDVRNNRASCTCPEFYKGNPQTRCYPECTKHEDCNDNEACQNFECINPCEGACGVEAGCYVVKHTPICSCPRTHTGDPYILCRPFTLDDLCSGDPCGDGADCTPGKDRSNNDRPVCTCPVGYIGNPLISCKRGDCTEHDDCPRSEACYAYKCKSPCFHNGKSTCGFDAACKVENHKPICFCERGWEGNPLKECRVSASARRPYESIGYN